MNGIRDFPKPQSRTDIRCWFGLVNQPVNYAQIRDLLQSLKPYLSPKRKFERSDKLDEAFLTSKKAIIEAIKRDVEIFDPIRRTCLRPNWSTRGIGYFLLQQHSACESGTPGCCDTGWKVTLAESRFLSTAEQCYNAPIEGEGMAVAWALSKLNISPRAAIINWWQQTTSYLQKSGAIAPLTK